MVRRLGWVLPLVVLGCTLAGCGKPGTGLPVGSAGPEIEGEDLDGKAFKLSDYRGKVVLLDFWSST
jgi:hypothetical protein